MDCSGRHFTHVHSCDVNRVQSATEWTASVHTSHMPKPVVFKVLRNGLLGYILHMSKAVMSLAFKVYTEWTASVDTSDMPKAVM